ncbi:MAG: DNA polymerase I [Oligoflexia bacterium]|nr:DNA polymerase I [Oligoflexia bacterium]
MKKVYLVDVSSLFFRSFYAIRQLNNSKGIPTNALYGFLSVITKLLKEHKPDSIAFCFDRPESGFREEIYEDYKANRSEPPDDLIKQFPYLPILAQALSIKCFDKKGYEADDIIGTLAQKAKKNGSEVVIVSSDKDFAQLVEPGVKIFDPAKEIYMDALEVRSKFGVEPNQIIDYLALIGDSSDNVPGVDGVGPKAAQKLLNEFENLDNIYKHIDDIKNERLRELLRSQKDKAYLSKKLVTIVNDVEVEFSQEEIKTKQPQKELLVPLLQELEFKTLLQRLIGDGGGGNEEKVGVEVVLEKKKKELLSTTNVNELDKKLKFKDSSIWLEASSSGGFAVSDSKTVFKYEGNFDQLSQWVNDKIKNQNLALAGFDTKALAHSFDIKKEIFKNVKKDTTLTCYCLGAGDDLDFKSLVEIYLEQKIPEIMGPEEKLSLVIDLTDKLDLNIQKTNSLKVLREIEYPLVPVLYRMECQGVLIDSNLLQNYSKELKSQSKNIEAEIFKLAGYEFNVGSPKQLAQVLFEKLKLPVVRKTKTGYSTDSEVLEKLKDQHPICNQILDWRELTKLNSTYVEALPQLVSEKTGRVHTSYNQAVTTTGRLSSTHPNLQNIPIRTLRGQKIREAFIAPKGNVLLSADYSQVELRILAHITNDKNLVQAFENDLDIHAATASEVFGVNIKEVTSEQRRTAKAINFGIVYGMSEFGLSENLKIQRELASEFIKKYFEKYPGVKKYMNDIVLQGTEKGYVETLFGRRRYYPGIKSSNRNIKQMAERAIINMPIQGTAADIIKKAMIKIDSEIKQAKMIMQVHDELVFEVESKNSEELKAKVKNWMEETTKLNVPLKVDVECGPHW